jgi:GT2 family glycosyltransferase
MQTEAAPLRATIVITTRNRREELRTMLPSALAQTPPCDVLVIDDASTDGTSDMLGSEFPSVRVERSDRGLGLIAQRNRAAELVRTPIIVSIDDDAHLPSTHTVAQALRDFDHPRVGAVAIPFVNVRSGPDVQQRAPAETGVFVTSSYIGTAHAVRRDVFRDVGAYRTSLVRQVEEPDFCLRMLDAGFVTRLGRSDPLIHDESPRRDLSHTYYYAFRNEVLHAWNNVPLPYLLVRLAKVAVASTLLALRRRQLGALVRGLAAGSLIGVRRLGRRRPVRRSTYRVDHAIRKRQPVLLDEIDALLPPPRLAALQSDRADPAPSRL